MKKVTLALSREGIFQEVALSSAYRGARGAESPESYERIAMTEADRRLGDSLFDKALGTLLSSIRSFASGIINSSSTLELSLVLSDDGSDAALTSLNSDLPSFFVNSILADWLEILNAPGTEKARQEANARATSITETLYRRPRPERPRR